MSKTKVAKKKTPATKKPQRASTAKAASVGKTKNSKTSKRAKVLRLSPSQLDLILTKGMANFARQIPPGKFSAGNKADNIALLMKKAGHGEGIVHSFRRIFRFSDFKFNAKWPSLRIAGPVAAIAIVGIVVYNLKTTQNNIELSHVNFTTETISQNTDQHNVTLEQNPADKVDGQNVAAAKKALKRETVAQATGKKNSVDAFLTAKEKEILATQKLRHQMKAVESEKVMGLPADKQFSEEQKNISSSSDEGEESSTSIKRSSYDVLKKNMLDKMRQSPSDKELYLSTKKFFEDRNDKQALSELDSIYKP